jgi:hypothetical protein
MHILFHSMTIPASKVRIIQLKERLYRRLSQRYQGTDRHRARTPQPPVVRTEI